MKDPLGLMGLTSPEQWVPPRAGSSSETHALCFSFTCRLASYLGDGLLSSTLASPP